ncbi:uncharacterized protein LOC128931407 [Callithrix jacchus]
MEEKQPQPTWSQHPHREALGRERPGRPHPVTHWTAGPRRGSSETHRQPLRTENEHPLVTSTRVSKDQQKHLGNFLTSPTCITCLAILSLKKFVTWPAEFVQFPVS